MPDRANGFETLPEEARSRIESLIGRFEDAWERGERPCLDEFLPKPDSDRLSALIELVHVDLERRLKAGEAARVEQYLARYPELIADPKTLLSLIVSEFGQRRRSEPALTCQEYVVRFPQLENEITRHFPGGLGSLPHPVDPYATAPPELGEYAASPGTATGDAAGPQVIRIRCPHCHNPIQLVDDRREEVLCPGCGSSFRLRETRRTTTQQSMRPLGKFQLLERVGLGAFGAVWKAHDTELDRIVALKIPHTGLLTSAAELERFHREARAAAQLRHPGIVTVHEVQILAGLPTIVADFINGVTLRDLLETRQLTFRESAMVLADIADALDYAHEMGLVHRDLKPANIMMDFGPSKLGEKVTRDRGTRLAGERLGRPLLMDFGLALRDEAEITMTLDGQVIGTPAYMSPEQAMGKGHQADRRSDVYSLGVILYELLTGELPFRGSKMMILQQVMHEEPRPPRKINDKIPYDLETICLKALAKPPGRRYQTARAFADDVRRFMKGEPIQARPIGTIERFARWCARNPMRTALSASLLASFLIGFVSVFALWRVAEGARQNEAIEKRNAQQALIKAEQSLYAGTMRYAFSRWHGTHKVQVDLLDSLLLQAGPPHLRSWEWGYLRRTLDSSLRTVRAGCPRVGAVALGAGGKILAFAGLDRPGIEIWDGEKTRLIRRLGDGPSSCMTFSPDGLRLAISGGKGQNAIRIWNVQSGQKEKSLVGHLETATALAFSVNAKRLASAGPDRLIKLWDVESGQDLGTLRGHSGPVNAVAFDPEGARILSGGEHIPAKERPGEWRLWDSASRKQIGEAAYADQVVYSLGFAPTGQAMAIGLGWGQVQFRNARTLELIKTYWEFDEDVLALAASPDGKRLACGGKDWSVSTLDATVFPACMRHIKANTGNIAALCFTEDGSQLVVGSLDGTVKYWDCRRAQNSVEISSKIKLLRGLGFGAAGEYLIAAGSIGQVKAWHTADLGQVAERSADLAGPAAVAVSANGGWIAAAGADRILKVWRDFPRTEIASIPLEQAVSAVTLSSQGEIVAVADSSGEVTSCDLVNGLKQKFSFPGRAIRILAVSPAEKLLAIGFDSGPVILQKLTNQEKANFLGEHGTVVESVAFSPDGTYLAIAERSRLGQDQPGQVRIWNLSEMKEIASLRGHSQKVNAVLFSPDGKRIVTAGEEGAVKIWDVLTFQDIFTLEPFYGIDSIRLTALAFSPDGRWLAAGEQRNGLIALWDSEVDPKNWTVE